MMLRRPVQKGILVRTPWVRYYTSSDSIRKTFIEYFKDKHSHKEVKSSSVVPLFDPTVPFVNAGMNQFKGIFLGQVEPPYQRVVNSQKCIRVGGKHNDLDMVGMDGTHHTFFEMLGNWSFGDYQKKEACQMAWDLLVGPYGLNPKNLLVTYFEGDPLINLLEDREVRDIWKSIGVPESRLKALPGKENFWEMGDTGPCGPCTEIHHLNSDGTTTEIWNIVFIQCNRDEKGKVTHLSKKYVDTGMGLERIAAILQLAPTNYDTDLFKPIIRAIEKNSKVGPYTGSYDTNNPLNTAYRKLADHARMISICLADGVFPSVSVNLKQIMRTSYKLSEDVFKNPKLLGILYTEVVNSLGGTYPELIAKEKDAKMIIEQEQAAYSKLRDKMEASWRDLVVVHPEVEALGDVQRAGFSQGYKEFKKFMKMQNTIKNSLGLSKQTIPGSLMFKLYDTHGLPEDVIQRIADLNKLNLDRKGFEEFLSEHKARHKTALKEQSSNKGELFNEAIERLLKFGVLPTKDEYKYKHKVEKNEMIFEPLRTCIVEILNEDLEWLDFVEPCEDRPYYLVTKATNFYCEEGGQPSDIGEIKISDRINFKVATVFKIRDFVFHKGLFTLEGEQNYVERNMRVTLRIDGERRANIMRNHTATHLLNAAVRHLMPNCVVGQVGSRVSVEGLSLSLSVYGGTMTKDIVKNAQELIRRAITENGPVRTEVLDSMSLSQHDAALSVPGETYPETGIRLVQMPLGSKELCCGTHVPTTGHLRDFCITGVKGAGSAAPTVYAITGERAAQARELFCRTRKLKEVIHLVEPQRCKEEVTSLRKALAVTCDVGAAPQAEYAECLASLTELMRARPTKDTGHEALQLVAITEVQEAVTNAVLDRRSFVVHFLRCSYLMQSKAVSQTLSQCESGVPVLLLGCAGGVIIAGCRIPPELITKDFDAQLWLSAILPVFAAQVLPDYTQVYAEMTATKVSLINCEQLVQDAMRLAVAYAKEHIPRQTAPVQDVVT